MNIVSSAGIFIAMAETGLDRLLRQRFALRKPDSSFDLPPPIQNRESKIKNP
jgi:hypothetical protein